MLSRLTRPAAFATASLCALAVLTACGEETPDEGESATGFDAVEVSGPVGEVPEIEWNALLEPGDPQAEVVEEGGGAPLEEGEKVLTNIAVSTDVSQDVSFDTYDGQALLLEVGSETEPTQPIDLLTGLLQEQIEPGSTTVGSRVAVTVDAKEEFGDLGLNLAGFGIGNEDGFVLVADLAAVPLDGPDGKSRPAPAWAPEIVVEKGDPTALDSAGLPEPDPKATDLGKAVLVEGTGPVVEKGDQIAVDYIGQTYGGKKPFDSGYSRPDPTIFQIGTGAVVKGWDQGLVGEKVGSRVLLEIPPKLGYGKKGQGEDIPADSTLYFVIDILAAA